MTIESEAEAGFVECDGFRFHYTVRGEGPPLVLLHGGGPGATGLNNYTHNIAGLAKQFTLYIPDLPGFGRSSKVFDRSDPFHAMGASLKSFMDGVGLGRANFVGSTLGASAALCFAMDYPDAVNRLVLMAPGGGYTPLTPGPSHGVRALLGYYAGPPTVEKMEVLVRNSIFDQSLVTAELIEDRYRSSLDPEVIANPPLQPPKPGSTTHSLWRDPRLASLPHPTLIIWGLEDRTNTPDGALSFRVIPNAEIRFWPKCAHWAQWEQPDRFQAAVRSFLASD